MPGPIEHQVQPDGYCETCKTYPCRRTDQPKRSAAGIAQGDRIELLLHHIARKLGIDPDTLLSTAQNTERIE